MRATFKNISFLKYTDAFMQVMAFIGMLLLMSLSDWGPFALFVEAAVQVISCLVWSFYFRSGIPKYRAGTFIRRAFLIVLAIWMLSFFIEEVAATVLYLMLLVGPIMGIAYFLITLWEAGYYGKARKAYYLL